MQKKKIWKYEFIMQTDIIIEIKNRVLSQSNFILKKKQPKH